MVLNSITYHQVFGLPLIAYGGMITLLMMMLTMSISILNRRGIRWLPFQWHPRFAYITLALALVHGILGILSYV